MVTEDLEYLREQLHIDICNNRHNGDSETLRLMRGSIRFYNRQIELEKAKV